MKWVSGADFNSTQRLQLLVITRPEVFGAFTDQELNDFVGFGKKFVCEPQRSASSSATTFTLGACVKISSMIKEDFYDIKMSSSYGLLRVIGKGLCVSQNKYKHYYRTLASAGNSTYMKRHPPVNISLIHIA
jgi:hypothetical protein